MINDEQIISAAILLLENATSNSLDPVHRASWAEDRDTVVEKLKEML